MKLWWKRFLCLHYWDNGYTVNHLDGTKHYKCIKCGKEKETNVPPISYIEG